MELDEGTAASGRLERKRVSKEEMKGGRDVYVREKGCQNLNLKGRLGWLLEANNCTTCVHNGGGVSTDESRWQVEVSTEQAQKPGM
mgnify:CR=1 FL=1